MPDYRIYMRNGERRDLTITGTDDDVLKQLQEEAIKIEVQDEGAWEVLWLRTEAIDEIQKKP